MTGRAHTEQAVLSVTRRRQLIGVLNTWDVHVDGIPVASLPSGKTVSVDVSSGTHTVVIWKKSGRARSNEFEIDVTPACRRALRCQIDPGFVNMTFTGSISTNLSALRAAVSDGGVVKGSIELADVEEESGG